MEPKLFVIVRGDIPKENQVAQLCHGTAEWCKRWQTGNRHWNNETIVCLSVRDLDELILWRRKMEMNFMNHSAFYEPDMSNELTALSCYTDSNFFSNLDLWK